MMSSQKSPLSNGTLDGFSHKQGKHNDEASYMSLHSHRRSSGLSNQQLLKQLHNGTSDLPSKIQQVNADTRSQRQRPLNGRLKPGNIIIIHPTNYISTNQIHMYIYHICVVHLCVVYIDILLVSCCCCK